MKYLITGASGQLGSEWTQFLKNKGESFTKYNSQELDITNIKRIEQILSDDTPDVVINCAAYTGVDSAESEKEKAFLVNETGVRHLAVSCRKNNIKLIHFSTDYVFSGQGSDRDKYPDGYDENADVNPINVYGQSKSAGEVALQKHGQEWLLIRVAWLCGRFGNNFVKTMLQLGQNRNSIQVVKDQTGSPTYTFDVVEKTWKLIESGKTGIYHISSKGTISWAELAEAIFQERNINTIVERIPSDAYPTEAERPEFSLLSTKKIEKESLEPIQWREGLKTLLNQLYS